MKERELLFRISNIVNGPISFPQAVEQITRLLEWEANVLGLFFDYPEGGGEHLGKLTLVFASGSAPGAFERRIADFVGVQLSLLVSRMRLVERRARLKREIALMEEDLAARKLMQRAEGLLIARRSLTAAGAKRWISETSLKTGRSKNEIAYRIIAYYQVLLERRIAS